MELNFHSDPGHGWLEIPTSVLVQLGIQTKISAYSYIDTYGQTAFLEEDCDAGVLMDALKDKGITVTFKELNTNNDSFIRNLPSF